MNAVFYYKTILSNQIAIEGKAVSFEPLAGNTGVIKLDRDNPANAKLIEGLEAMIAKGRGGVARVNEATYEEKKNSAPPPTSKGRYAPNEKLRIMPSDLSPFKRAEAAAAEADKTGLRTDGPTLEEYRAAGYTGDYPPEGYAPRKAWEAPTKSEPAIPVITSSPQSLPETPARVTPENHPPEPGKVSEGPAPLIKPAAKKLTTKNEAPKVEGKEADPGASKPE